MVISIGNKKSYGGLFANDICYYSPLVKEKKNEGSILLHVFFLLDS